MESKKMRRTLLLDLPRNVSQREYLMYTLQCGLALVGFAGAVGILFSSLRGDAQHRMDALEAIPPWSVADAAKSSSPEPLIRLEGELAGSASAAMPDQPEVEVVLVSIELRAKTSEGGGGAREAVLYRWEHNPRPFGSWMETLAFAWRWNETGFLALKPRAPSGQSE